MSRVILNPTCISGGQGIASSVAENIIRVNNKTEDYNIMI